MPDYRANLSTHIVQKLTAGVEDDDVRIERLVAEYRVLGAASVMMLDIGAELRRIMLRHHEPLGEKRFEKVWEAFEDYLVEGSGVIVKNMRSGQYEWLDVEDF